MAGKHKKNLEAALWDKVFVKICPAGGGTVKKTIKGRNMGHRLGTREKKGKRGKKGKVLKGSSGLCLLAGGKKRSW